MSSYSEQTKCAEARQGFSEEAIWREAVGEFEPLRTHAVDGPIDAPMWVPIGSVNSGFKSKLQRPE